MEQNTQPTPQTPPLEVQPSVPQTPAKPKNVLVVVLIVLIMLLSLGAAGFFAYQYTQLKNQVAQAKPTPVMSPSPTPDPTANWKTYTNQQFSYVFKCPITSTHKTVTLTTFDGIKFPYSQESCAEGQNQTTVSVWKIINQDVFTLSGKTKELSGASLKPINYKETTLGQNKMITYQEQNLTNQIERSVAIIVLTDKYIRIEGFSQTYFDQILSTFKFTEQSPTVSPTPAVPPNWIRHTFNTYGLTMYTPDDWQSSITDYPADSNSLVKFWKKSSPTIVPIQLDIKSNWDNTGNAESQPKNFMVDGSIPAYRMDPPTKNQQTLDRYQTNVYFEHNSKVYVFECVHNWTLDYVNTCDTMLSTLQFTQ